tara:strand:+ start:902 stop:1105 length:204 start_codon:yes stop_codon:yes gene_type:complete
MQLGLIEERPDTTAVNTFLQFVGHETSEVTGIAFEIGRPLGGPLGNVRVVLEGLQPAERRPSGSGSH